MRDVTGITLPAPKGLPLLQLPKQSQVTLARVRAERSAALACKRVLIVGDSMLVGMAKLMSSYVGPRCSLRPYEGKEALTCVSDLDQITDIWPYCALFYVSAGNALYSKQVAEEALACVRIGAERVAGVVLLGSTDTWTHVAGKEGRSVVYPGFFQEVRQVLREMGVAHVQYDGATIRDSTLPRHGRPSFEGSPLGDCRATP